MTMNCVFSCHCQGLSPMNVRYLYAAIFLLANLSAWFARENTVSYHLKQRLSGCQGDRGCLAVESVLVASHAFFLFFMTMFFSTVRTGKVNELRNSWHSGWWPVKIALFMVCSLISVLAPSWWIQIYESEDDVSYGYGFFHFAFAAGSMYVRMVFVGWDTHHTMKQWSVDIGWMSTWVHIANEALVVVFYIAILVARIFGIGLLRHLLAKIFGTGDRLHSGESQTTTTHLMRCTQRRRLFHHSTEQLRRR
ncbi:Serinc-domain containing serine and sphingolipid biosynthesis protein [Zea mays]|nr:Serinc-domain containing serine and sphingolipid biosynthesis protein [Zea mays]